MTDVSTSSSYEFPADFLWGAAAASYQIEGAVDEDGKGPSVWDMFCQHPGAVFGDHSGAVACDHYHRYREDVELMRGLGLGGYRLSICWPRILPEGMGRVNEAGIAFYDRLFDRLLEAGITPWVTLFHWDYPLELFRRGGWLNPDSSSWFAEYAHLIAERFSDRVTNYFTLNEPQVYIGFGHLEGCHAPGLKLSVAEVLQAGHHTLLAHGKAVQALRSAAKSPLTIGYAPVGLPKLPASNDSEDIELARRATFEITERTTWNNAWWMDPVFLGHYPEQGLSFFGKDAPKVRDGDLELIAQPIDRFGCNIYQGQRVKASTNDSVGYEEIPWGVGAPRTAFNWPVTPDALYWGPKFFFDRYRKPLVITENGLSCRDWVSLDGAVHDPSRIDFTTRYLRALHRAIQDGIDVRGYFHWSIMDNFEWAAGYRERFGLVHVDYQTQKRTPKDSYHWYRRVISDNGRSLDGRS